MNSSTPLPSREYIAELIHPDRENEWTYDDAEPVLAAYASKELMTAEEWRVREILEKSSEKAEPREGWRPSFVHKDATDD